MWEEGIEFGFLKIYIKCKSGESSGKEVGDDDGGCDVDVNEDELESDDGRDHYEAPVNIVIKDAHNARDNSDEDSEDEEDFDIPTVGGDEPNRDYNWVEECETDNEEFVIAWKNKSVFKSTIVDNGERLGVDPQFGNDDGHLSEYTDSDDEGFDTPCNS
ncbi:uncharacterized protein LOC127805572 [Diospyros lotus]|uniref:uncharacterized protein LOC127805572 n=1 Tax=Diospyros lotus TaxID=55363 RepID=UPI002258EEBD|nr:uncharacterized protein LOC127805572 [Diospyros lotus]